MGGRAEICAQLCPSQYADSLRSCPADVSRACDALIPLQWGPELSPPVRMSVQAREAEILKECAVMKFILMPKGGLERD